MARAEIAISEYLEGRFVSELSTLQKDLAIARSNLLSAQNMLDHARLMAESDYISQLEIEEKEFAVAQAELVVKLTETDIDVLERFTKEEELATLRGDLNAARAKYEAERERAVADEQRLRRAEEEFAQCVIRAERAGMVIYPNGEEWEDAPDIEEGATVHKDQILLLMPDLSRMQVTVGIHESVVDRVNEGLPARVTLPGQALDGSLSYVASVANPAGWWTGNVVKYDAVVDLPSVQGLKPGMSVEVEVVLARHENVLLVPTAAILDTPSGYACWVQNDRGLERRPVQIGDASNMFVVVQSGIGEGERVIVDPLAHVPEAQAEAAAMQEPTTDDTATVSQPAGADRVSSE